MNPVNDSSASPCFHQLAIAPRRKKEAGAFLIVTLKSDVRGETLFLRSGGVPLSPCLLFVSLSPAVGRRVTTGSDQTAPSPLLVKKT